ncbi:M16 family metallopeptidase [Nakamurella sp.]|uniref:M16 family metallopeptidase n=1 Tax=Nakamurella sp. TaxID=1869182 RepID=UPI0037840E8E
MATPARRTRTTVLERAADGSAVTASLLPGGLRVVTESVPGARSATIGVWVGVGSVDETPRLAGASHFLEHLLFKGTRTRTGYEIADAVDAVGGELNAFTSHEYTCYYARILAEQAHLAVDLVCDVVLDAVIAADDVDTERQVILEEIAMRDDDPEDTLADAFAAVVFAGHPVAAPVIGSAETITAMSRTQIAGYYRRRYAPPKMVVAIAGGVDHGDALRWVRSAFRARLAVDPAAVPAAYRLGRGRPRPAGRPLVVTRDTEQAHLTLGMPAGDRNAPDRYVLAVLSAALGGGMSSRLFRSIREERGLAYSCYSATAAYADVGALSIYAGCAPDHVGEVAKLIGQELVDVAERGLRPDELKRVQGQLCGSLALALEDSESRMSRIGKSMLVRSEFRTVEDEFAAIRAVTADEVAGLARKLLRNKLSAAVVGPYRSPDELPAALRDLAG